MMGLEQITPDEIVYWRWGFLTFNATLVYTWITMAVLAVGSWLVTRNLSTGPHPSRTQCLLELVTNFIRDQIRQIVRQDATPYLPFIGTLVRFVGFCNLLSVVPWYIPPTASLSTTAALAICVFVAVPVYGIRSEGVKGYLKNYIRPTFLMLPFNIISEISRTLALAVRLFGNIMSGVKITAILLAIVPFFFPVVLQLLGLLTGLIQAFIFAVLATVYIGSGVRAHRRETQQKQDIEEGDAA